MRGIHYLQLASLLPALLCGCQSSLERQGRPAKDNDSEATARTGSAPPAPDAPERHGGPPVQPAQVSLPPADEAAALPPAKRQPFSIAALYEVKRLDAPQLSPDGRQILLTVTRYELAAGKSNSDLYRVNADGSDLRRLTHDPASDSQARWLPDGKSLVFVSNRSGEPQLWRMPVDGGRL